MTFILPLHVLHREVHRFRGVVDRFGSFVSGPDTIHTLCIRGLHHARSNRPLLPAHWWFRLREGWTTVGIQPGDEVIFTAKVQRCSKGLDQHGQPQPDAGRERRQVIGIGNRVRDVVVSRRAWQASPRSAEHTALVLEVEVLRQQLSSARSSRTLWLVPTPSSSPGPHLPGPSLHDWERNLSIGPAAGS
ncbi:hypothetical protein KBY97_00590 [Synechococcus sp. ATX 2A4]|uniref:hypothetical protein n=1 Tax=Synechococcus sp. ATX 2A4 TaxID=2823727 RepID=UPI0020CF9C62|nr:hypothetical protein [Synechococcus sp. ATX 2A4]MCP9883624.1 hypothetical protein [Synechococcus sp. ATX 2A4]